MARLGSRTSSYPGRQHYRSVSSRMPVLSATIFDAVFVRAEFGTCRLGLITVWLPVRVLPAPPRSPALTPSSPSPRNTLDFPRFGAGVMARSRSLRETKTVRKRIGADRADQNRGARGKARSLKRARPFAPSPSPAASLRAALVAPERAEQKP